MLNETEATIKRQYTTCVCGSVVSNSLPPHGLQPARLPCPRNSPGKNTGMGSHLTSPGDLSNPGIKPKSFILQADSLLSESPGTPKKLEGIKERVNISRLCLPWNRQSLEGGEPRKWTEERKT